MYEIIVESAIEERLGRMLDKGRLIAADGSTPW